VQSKPVCDYTFPDLITLLVTDLGIFTPSAVCDELLKIYCKWLF
jgi:translation initiation factor eIF-2B subunit alpha